MKCTTRRGCTIAALICTFLCLAPQSPAQGGIADPTPGEIEEDLGKRMKQWRAWQLSVSTKKSAQWQVKKRGAMILVVSKSIAGTRNLTHISNLASAMRKWLDKHFKGITPWKVPKPVVRVCSTSNQARDFRQGLPGPYIWKSGEVVIVHGIGRALLGTFTDLGKGLTSHYVDMQSPSFLGAMPDWLKAGLPNHAGQASMTKKAGFIFRANRSSWRQGVAMVKAGTLIPAEAVVKTPHGELSSMRRNSVGDCRVVSELLIRYLTFSRGQKGKTRGFIKNYLAQLHADLYRIELETWMKVMRSEMQAKLKPSPSELRQNFRDYLATLGNFKRHPEADRLKMKDSAFAAAFARWKPADWRRLDKALRSYIQNGLR